MSSSSAPRPPGTGAPENPRTEAPSLRIAHIAQISRAQQSQIGLLGQIFDIHGRAHASPQEAQKAPVPALLPPREHRTIRHAASVPKC